jgi:hypothetical protein
MEWRFARRTLEVALGLIVWAGVLLALALIWGGIAVLVYHDPDLMWVLVVMPAAVALGFFCAITGWRLVTGRERRGGGLFNPAMVDHATAAVALLHAARANLWFGPDSARRESETAAEALGRAREHWRKRSKRRRKP